MKKWLLRALALIVLLFSGWFTTGVLQMWPSQRKLAEFGRVYDAKDYVAADRIIDEVVEIARANAGEASPEHVVLMHARAVLKWRVGNLVEAEAQGRKVIETLRKFPDKGHDPELLEYAPLLLANVLTKRGVLDEAGQLLDGVIAARNARVGPNDSKTLTAVRLRAEVDLESGQLDRAVPVLKSAMARAEEATVPEWSTYAEISYALLWGLARAGRANQAEAVAQEALAKLTVALGEDHELVAKAIGNVALTVSLQTRHSEADTLYDAVIAKERALGRDTVDQFAVYLNNAVDTKIALGKFAEADRLARESIAVSEQAFGPNSEEVVISLNRLADALERQGENARAINVRRDMLDRRMRELPPDHPLVLSASRQLAGLLDDAEGMAMLQDALGAETKRLGRNSVAGAKSLFSIAKHHDRFGRTAEALSAMREAYSIVASFGSADTSTRLIIISGLADLERKSGNADTAMALLQDALSVSTEDQFASQRYGILLDLVEAFDAAKRFVDGEQALEEARQLCARVSGPGSIACWTVAAGASLHYARADDTEKAVAEARIATKIGFDLRALAATTPLSGAETGNADEQEADYNLLMNARFHSELAYRVAEKHPDQISVLRDEAFQVAQLATATSAGRGLGQMAARQTRMSPAAAALSRDLQGRTRAFNDLQREWAENRASGAATEKSAALAKRVAVLEHDIMTKTTELRRMEPQLTELLSETRLPIASVQSLLGTDEVLLQVSYADNGPLAWFVTRDTVIWKRLSTTTDDLVQLALELRCGLDSAAWQQDTVVGLPAQRRDLAKGMISQAQTCRNAFPDGGQTMPQGELRLPFDLARAHRLYATLFADVEPLVRGKHLLLVVPDELARVPFHALLTRSPSNDDFRTAPWMVRETATTLLPSIGALASLRRVARPSAATRPYVGFGNPLLDGPDLRYAPAAKVARARQTCGDLAPQRPAGLLSLALSSIRPVAVRGGLADSAQIKRQIPLPETAAELCDVARDLGADATAVYLGTRASESQLKALSASGGLAKYRVLHFATHATLAGQIRGAAEPGIILTPPNRPSADDDGYVTANEIAGLNIDADWVILSACNTAGGEAGSGQALSGLARAFFYAGARALLVSHWEVNSDAAVLLVSKAVREIVREPHMGRAEALRRAMLTLIEGQDLGSAHPAIWAPFVVVGEGGAGR